MNLTFKGGIMKKKLLAGAGLIFVVFLFIALAVVPPPCDEYLDWCVFTWCPQNNHTPSDVLACQTQCAVYWMEHCN